MKNFFYLIIALNFGCVFETVIAMDSPATASAVQQLGETSEEQKRTNENSSPAQTDAQRATKEKVTAKRQWVHIMKVAHKELTTQPQFTYSSDGQSRFSFDSEPEAKGYFIRLMKAIKTVYQRPDGILRMKLVTKEIEDVILGESLLRQNANAPKKVNTLKSWNSGWKGHLLTAAVTSVVTLGVVYAALKKTHCARALIAR